MTKNTSNNNSLSSEYDSIISLLGIYFSEWHHRSQTLWSQTFKFYYAILIIILLPNLVDYFKLQIPNLPIVIFRIIGLFLSFVFLYVSIGYAIRLQSVGITYQKLINKLPEEYRREKIENIAIKNIHIGKIFAINLSYIICFSLFLSLLLLATVLIFIQ